MNPPIESRPPEIGAPLAMRERARAMLENDFLGWESERIMALVEALKEEILLKQDASPEGLLLPNGSPTDSDVARPIEDKISRILIVDDDPFTFAVLEDTFEGICDVIRADNGKAALDLAFKHKPDLILLDVMMPGINGYDVCRRLKADRQVSNIPVIFITGLGDLQAESTGLTLGAVDFITKPLNPVSVRARVNNHIKLQRTTDQLTRLAQLDRLLRDELLGALDFKWGA